MNDTKEPTKLHKIFYFCAAVLAPGVFLFYLYSNNRFVSNLLFRHTIVLAAVLAAVSVCVFMLFRLLTRDYGKALLALLIFWLPFWLFEQVYSFTLHYLPEYPRVILLVCAVFGIAIVILYLRKGIKPFHKDRPIVFLMLAIVICVLFVINIVPGISMEIKRSTAGNTEKGGANVNVKSQFIIDETLPTPDIYWFHMEGLLSFDTMEHFFDDPQTELRNGLADRGFILNENAQINAGETALALVAMLSPGFYDSYFGEIIADSEHDFRTFNSTINRALAYDGVSILRDVMPYHEFFNALHSKGYTTIMSSIMNDYFYPSLVNIFYRHYVAPIVKTFSEDAGTGYQYSSEIVNLFELMVMTTPFSMVSDALMSIVGGVHWIPLADHSDWTDALTEDTQNLRIERDIYNALLDSFDTQSPKFSFIRFNYGHRTQWVRVTTNAVEYDPLTHDAYINAHYYDLMIMLRAVDLILDRNPDAIIVLQADHGFLGEWLRFMSDKGYQDSEAFELHTSTFSAVRIPLKYGGLDEPLDPLNITRELVNRYVGENYELLP